MLPTALKDNMPAIRGSPYARVIVGLYVVGRAG